MALTLLIFTGGSPFAYDGVSYVSAFAAGAIMPSRPVAEPTPNIFNASRRAEENLCSDLSMVFYGLDDSIKFNHKSYLTTFSLAYLAIEYTSGEYGDKSNKKWNAGCRVFPHAVFIDLHSYSWFLRQ